jgi:hypothetical protein
LKKRDLERELELQSVREELDQLKSQMGRHVNDVSASASNRHLMGSNPAPKHPHRSVSQPIGYFPLSLGSRDPRRFDSLLGRTGTYKSSSSISLADLEGETTYL